MQFQIHRGVWSNSKTTRLATNRTSEKTRCGSYKRSRDFEDHDNDWENHIILDKNPDMFKRRIKRVIFIKANGDGYLINRDKGCPFNECWNEFSTLVKKNTRKV